MKNWQKGGIALLLCAALSGCKAWTCGCPMSKVEEVRELPVDHCSLSSCVQPKNNDQPETSN
ncbi:MAG: hypothetical protein KDD06_14945 [Phaeodactylibacter sp.]|nr:hypothetical protein [Phaeodactylibacter sp.]